MSRQALTVRQKKHETYGRQGNADEEIKVVSAGAPPAPAPLPPARGCAAAAAAPCPSSCCRPQQLSKNFVRMQRSARCTAQVDATNPNSSSTGVWYCRHTALSTACWLAPAGRKAPPLLVSLLPAVADIAAAPSAGAGHPAGGVFGRMRYKTVTRQGGSARGAAANLAGRGRTQQMQ